MTDKAWLDETKTFEERAQALVCEMTLEEKVFQTLFNAPAIERLGVPAYNYWNEALHGVARAGVATVFPQAIGLAASFDEELLGQVADTISTEARAKFNMQQKFGDRDIYKGLTFWSPNVNIFRDPRWGRGHETFGEDPFLSGRLGVSFIRGMQGDDERYMKVAACAKHFAVHSGPEDQRHSFNAVVSEQDLRETYLPAFHACVTEAGVEAVMGAYNRTNGEACCGSKKLLVDILRGEWGFRGHVTSDCWALKDFHEFHMVTKNQEETVALAMNSGCDLNCGNLYVHLLQAVRDGLVEESVIDRAVTRLFTTRMKLGLFDRSEEVPYNGIGYDRVDTEANRKLNREASRRTVCLLKNADGLLPLDISKLRTIGVVGPNADNRKALVGNYEGTASEYVTVLDGIRELAGDDVRVVYSEGCHLFRDRVQGLGQPNDRIAEARAVAELSDVVIAVMGLDPGLEGEEGDQGNEFASGDKPNLELPGLQGEVLKALVESGKPVVLVLLGGSALAIPWAEEHVPAILDAWYPGAQGGRAVADVLFGRACPEGKLPVTFYRTSEELPAFTDYSMKNRTYRYMKQPALYPFGYGLSYTSWELTNTTAEGSVDDGVVCRAVLRNTGAMAGAQTVQVYVKAPLATGPNAQLKGLRKIRLQPGESAEVAISLDKEAFGVYNEKGLRVLLPGEYKIYIGMSQPDARSAELLGVSPSEISLLREGGEIAVD
jgi:Beta-glucosidase-related glycosidases|uniref:Putative carbohydrate-active enzyme n=1 Tax=uncultured organism TaxID=155900 RepID=E9NSI7_9ZZZZ|nr:putative carbohydrate-active enzyme [uncultured organism]